MRVFLCDFGNFSLAIPMHYVSSLALNEDCSAIADFPQAVMYNEENRNTYISLPWLLNLPLENLRHSLVLKKNENTDDNDIMEDKTILVTTEVECEEEIPREAIYPIPHSLRATQFSALFNGIQFKDKEVPVLFLNLEHFINDSKYAQTEAV